MKKTKTPITILIVLAALSASGQIYDWKYETSEATDINWSDIVWNKTETTQTRDRYYLNINNQESATVNVKGGANVTLTDDASIYVNNYSKLVIGDTDGTQTSTFTITSPTDKDTFMEITGHAGVVVNKNGVLNVEGRRQIRFWDVANDLPDDYIHFLVDGGTVNGNINVGISATNVGTTNLVFRNNATLNRNTEVNPLSTNGKGTLTFDNSTYNVWNKLDGTNNGWGNHVMNTGSDNQDYRTQITITNASIWNGAGVVSGSGDDKTVTYYDFSSDITNSYTAADLTLGVGRATSADSFFNFAILDGSKVSAKNVILSAQDNTKSKHTMGTFTFQIQGASADKVSMLAATGQTNMNLARTNEESTWSNNFLLKGNASYQTAGGFNIGSNEDVGGTGNIVLSGDNNTFKIGNNLNFNPGYNNTTSVSEAKINISTEAATNSSFIVNGVNVYSQGNSQIDVKLVGSTNTVSFGAGDFNMNSSKVAGNSVAKVEVGVSNFTSAKNFRLSNYASGDQILIFSNGVVAEIASAQFTQSDTAGGTAKSYYVIKDGASLTTLNDNGYNTQNSAMRSGEVGFMLLGDGSSFISKGQMNINPGSGDNTGGLYAIRMLGTNGLVEAQKNLHMSGLLTGDSAGYLFEMQGSGNVAKINTFNLGRNESTAGTYKFFSQSSSADAKNVLEVTNTTISLEGQMVESTAKREFILAGNTILRTSDGGKVTMKVQEYGGKTYLGGEGLFEVRGSGNEANMNELKFGNGLATAGTATMRVVGGGSTISSTVFRVQSGATTSLDNRIGGILEYKFDSTGISTIQVDNNIENVSGILSIDFSGLADLSYDGERFVLISTKDSGLENKLSQYWIDFAKNEVKDRAEIISSGASDEEYVFAVEDSLVNVGYKDFVVYYTANVPEPSTYAAIFGAIALAFAAYRRRSSK